MVEGRPGPVHELQYGHLHDVDLLGRIVAIEELGPELRVHLELHVVEVALAGHAGVLVALGHVV